MDKIQEQLKKNIYNVADMQKAIQAGIKAADLLLPIEKPCPACNGHGLLPITLSGELSSKPDRKCPKCKNGTIQIYYTPEQYEKITGTKFPDEGMVYILYEHPTYWTYCKYKFAKKMGIKSNAIVVIQTTQPAPDANYQPETE